MIRILIKEGGKRKTIFALSFLILLLILFFAFFPFERNKIAMVISGENIVENKDDVEMVVNNQTFDFDNHGDDEIFAEISPEAIAAGEIASLRYADSKIVKIETIEISRNRLTVFTIKAQEIKQYIERVEEVDFEENEVGIVECNGTREGALLAFNQNFYDKMYKASSSLLIERILIIFFIFFLYVFTVCFLLYRTYKKNTNIQKIIQKEILYVNTGHISQRFVRDIFKYGYFIIYSAKTDLKAEVANSYLNWFWWLLEPFFNMLVYVIVFGQIMGNSISNYATFIFSALLMWNFFNKVINYSVKLVRNNKDIVTKIYLPKFILLLSNMVLNVFKLLFSLIVLAVMLCIFRVQIDYHILWEIPIYSTLFLLTFGLGMIFMHFGVFVDDLAYAVGILLNMLMFLSGIFYDVMTTLPEPLSNIMMICNPIAMLVKMMRDALLYQTSPNALLLLIWFIISVVLCYIGVRLVYKNENGYVKVV